MRRKLSEADQQEFLETLAELTQSKMPLPAGLRAAARESRSKRLANQLKGLAKTLESGEGWQAHLLQEADIPDYLLGLVRAGVRSGDLGDALDGLVDQRRAARDTWHTLFWSLAYPVSMLILTIGLLVVALLLIVRPMEELYEEFGMGLPLLTEILVKLSRWVPLIAFWSSLSIVGSLLCIRLLGGPVGWIRFVSAVPVFGPMVHWAGAAEMLRLLQVMLHQQVPLSEALELTSQGTRNANMSLVARWLAFGTQHGKSLADLMAETPRVPPPVVPMVRWGERHNALPQALANAYELLESRVRWRSTLLSILLPPLLLIFAGISIGLMAIGMFLPLVSMTQSLT